MIKEPMWLPRGPYPVHVAFVPNKKAWKRAMKELGVTNGGEYPSKDAQATTIWDTRKGTVCLVTVGDHIDQSFCKLGIVALLVHEIVHVWQRIKENIGEDAPGSECEAYSVQWLTMNVIEAFEDSRFMLVKGKGE